MVLFKKMRIIKLLSFSVIITTICIIISMFSKTVSSLGPGPRYPPAKGEVWPKAILEVKKQNYLTLCPVLLNITVENNNCDILQRAVNRYLDILKGFHDIAMRNRKLTKWESRHGKHRHREENYRGSAQVLRIYVGNPCEEYPSLEMKEDYSLTIDAESRLNSSSVWGALRGLETFSQLFYLSDDYNEIRINETIIFDYPAYKYRGYLLDTGRHFVSMANILKTIDALAINKMNVFHWHMVDDESFPYQSDKLPTLSAMGSFHPSMVYTKEDIKKVVDYARDRGVRVIPEFDVPGHTRSWGVALPHVLTKCYELGKVNNLGPINPIKNMTYKVIRQLFEEVQDIFPDKYFHVGGDEVKLNCWNSNPDLKQYMKDHNMTINKLFSFLMNNVIGLLKNGTTPIVWQDAYDVGVSLPKETLIQVWRYHWIEKMVQILKEKRFVLFSSSWYLDYLNDGWDTFLRADPRRMVYGQVHETLLENIVGGEVCMWGEMMDDTNVISRSWPRSSAVAERLWSGIDYSISSDPVTSESRARIEEHTCRMRRRGIEAEPPSGPGFCLVLP